MSSLHGNVTIILSFKAKKKKKKWITSTVQCNAFQLLNAVAVRIFSIEVVIL